MIRKDSCMFVIMIIIDWLYINNNFFDYNVIIVIMSSTMGSGCGLKD